MAKPETHVARLMLLAMPGIGPFVSLGYTFVGQFRGRLTGFVSRGETSPETDCKASSEVDSKASSQAESDQRRLENLRVVPRNS